MSKTSTNLLFLAVGAALGAAVGYIAASDKKEEWLRSASDFAGKIKDNVISAACKGKDKYDELTANEDGE